MSERINTNADRASLRWQLLTTVSALALLGSVYGTDKAKADDDSDRPTVWVELGGQFEHLDAGEAQFAPPFILATPRPAPETVSPLSVGHPPRNSIGGEGKISFEPEGTNWVLSVSARYGRSNAGQHLHQQTNPTQPIFPGGPYSTPSVFQHVVPFIDTGNHSSETHAILDFQAGKDVGLGMFGGGSSSVFSLGVRFAQFGSKSNVAFKSDPDAHPIIYTICCGANAGKKFPLGGIYHSNAATAVTARNFRGLGPSISWNASAPVVGSPKDGEIAFDWGANAAILFGRQKAFVHHQTTAQYHNGNYGRYGSTGFRTTLYRHTPPDQARSRTVIVPNVGGFAGLTFRISNFKMSAGYRGDFFFGAMDGGIDAAKKENRGFYGPFASVSVGLGG